MDEPSTLPSDQPAPSDESNRGAGSGPEAPPPLTEAAGAAVAASAPQEDETASSIEAPLPAPEVPAPMTAESDVGTDAHASPAEEAALPDEALALVAGEAGATVAEPEAAAAGAPEETVESVPTAVAPLESAPPEAAPLESTSAEAAALESAPPEVAPLESTSAEAVALESPPPEVAPLESTSAEAVALESPPAEVAPTEVPAKAHVPDEHVLLARENARRLESEIESLRSSHSEGERVQFRAFFEHERRLHALFKELRPVHAADRHRLWNAFKQAGAEVRRAQQEEWESRRYQSIEARETVEEKMRSAESLTQGAQGTDDYRKADALLNEVRALLASNSPGSPGAVLIGPDRRACWDRWREVRDELRRRRGVLQEQDYQALAEPVAEVAQEAGGGDPFKAIQQVKELQARLGKAYLRRGQFEELRRRLSEAWQAAQARVAEQRQERATRRSEWRERMEGHLARWRETLEHKQSQREHLLAQLEKLEGMEKNARSEDFAVQVRGWKDETTDKLRRTEEFIADLEERIRSATKKLGGRGPRERVAREPEAPAEENQPGGAPGEGM